VVALSINKMVDVGAAAAQAVIAATTVDPDAAALRVGVLEFLRVYANDVPPTPEFTDLLTAYREWLDVAVALYSTGDETKVREFVRSRAVLGAEMDLVAARSTVDVT
jgi:hypothetical protein